MVGQADNLSGQDNNTIITPHDPFVVMAKPVGPNCNLECSYCYYLETKRHYEAPYQFRMSDAVLETYIRQCIEASPGPTVSFVWHGGEPTLAGLDFYKRALELQKRYLPAKWSCWNNLQTNGTLLNEDWCSFIANEHFDVGISIDGTRWEHDRYRKDLHGKGTYETAVAAVRRLQTYGVQPDLLCTVTSTSAQEPLDIYRALRDLNTGWIQFIPIVRQDSNGQITPDSISSEAYGHFLSVVFDEWIYHDLGKLNVQFFAEMALVWSGGRANPCWMAPICGRVLIVEHDGSVYSCDHFVTPEHRIGNLRTSTLSTLVDSPAQLSFGENKRTGLPSQCRNCRWLAVCNGECPKNRLILADDGSPGLNYLCKGLRFFFTHSERPLKRVIERQKQGIHSEAIMAELCAELVAKWKGVGRNDPCPCGSGLKAKQCCWSQRP